MMKCLLCVVLLVISVASEHGSRLILDHDGALSRRSPTTWSAKQSDSQGSKDNRRTRGNNKRKSDALDLGPAVRKASNDSPRNSPDRVKQDRKSVSPSPRIPTPSADLGARGNSGHRTTLSQDYRNAEAVARAARDRSHLAVEYGEMRVSRQNLGRAYAEAGKAAGKLGLGDRADRYRIKSASAFAGGRAAAAWQYQEEVVNSQDPTTLGQLSGAHDHVKETTRAYEELRRNGGKDSLSRTRGTSPFNFESSTDTTSTGSVNQVVSPGRRHN